MRQKKYFSVVLSCITIIGLLAGCSGNGGNSGNTGNNAGTSNNNALSGEKDITISLEKEYSHITADENGRFYGIDMDFSSENLNNDNSDETKDALDDVKVSLDILDSTGKLIKNVALPNGNVANLAATKSNIFVFYFNNIQILNADGGVVKELKFDKEIFVSKPVAAGDKVFFLYQENAASEGISGGMELAYVDSNVDSVKMVGIADVFGIMKYKDNILKVYSYDTSGEVKETSYDYKDLSIKDSKVSSLNIAPDTQYCENNDKLYMFDYNGIYEKKYGENSSKNILPFSDSNFSSLLINGNVMYLLGNFDKKIRVLDIETLTANANNKKQIVIYTQEGAIVEDDYSVFGKALQKFKSKHSDIFVTFEDVDFEKYYDDLNAKVMTQDNSFDVFYLPEGKVDNYIKNGVMVNLKDSKQIMDNFNNNINPNLTKVVSRDDYYFGVPTSFYPYVLTINLSKFEELGISPPDENWSYDEFFAILDKVKEKDEDLYFQTAQTVYNYLIDYINFTVDAKNKQVTIDKAKLVDALNKLKTVQDNSTAYYETNENGFGSASTFLISYGTSYGLAPDDTKLKNINPPVISKENPEFSTQGTGFLAINKKSKNIELCEELLSYIYSEDIVLTRDAMTELPIYKDMLKYNDILKADLKEELKNGSENIDEALEEAFNHQKLTDDYVRIYNNILSKYKPSVEVLFSDAGSKILNDFNEGKISSEDTADKIINLVKNMIEE